MYREFFTNGGTEAEARRVLGTGTDANGNEYYYRRAGAEPGKVYVDPELRKKTSGAKARKENLQAQTHGKSTFKPRVAERRSGEYEPQPTNTTRATTLIDHHIRAPGIYETFFDGLTPAEQAELTRYAAEDLLEPLGDSKYNRARIPGIAHDGVREEPGGYHEWDRKYKSGKLRPQGKNKYTIPQSAKLNQRKELLRQFLGSEQGKMNQALFTEVMANKHPKSEYWQQKATVLRTHKPNVNPDLPFDGTRPEGMLPPDQGPTTKLKPKPSGGLKAGKKFGLNIRSIDPLQSFWREVKQNPLGSTMGGIYGLEIDPMYREALQAKDPLQAGLILGTDIAAGAVAEGAGKFGLNIASRIAPTTTANTLSALNPALQAVSKVAGPVMLAYQVGGSQDIRKLKRATPESIQRYERETGRSATSDETAVAGLSEEESRQYLSGGGNTAMTKYGWTMEQTMQQGRKNLELQRLENMKEYK